jgi:murein DD-endopeptidase MepM/ murein hydrolase activator NlpD
MKKFNILSSMLVSTLFLSSGMVSAETTTVKRGDTLSHIAVKNGISVKQLMKDNGLNNSVIHPGQKLEINGKTVMTQGNENATIYNCSYLNLRKGPGLGYPSIDEIKSGTPIEVIGQSAGWFEIKVDGQVGFVSSYFVNKKQTAKPVHKKIISETQKIVPIKKVTPVIVKKVVPEVKKIVIEKKETTQHQLFIRPSAGYITSHYGERAGKLHSGVDLALQGDVSIVSAAQGVVSRSYYHSSYGEVVFVKHTLNGKNYETVYAHMRTGSRAVEVGDTVQQGQNLGKMGSTGHSTGQHLHFEIHEGSFKPGRVTSIDPLKYIE